MSIYKLITRIIFSTLIIVISYFLLTIVFNNYKADVSYKSVDTVLLTGDVNKALELANNAILLNPLEPNYYRARAKVYITMLPQTKNEENRSLQIEIKNTALRDLKKAMSLNENNLVTARNLVPLYYFLAANDVSQPDSPQNIDYMFVNYAQDFYRKVELMSQNDVGVFALVAKYQKRLDLVDDYNFSVEKIRQLRPDLLDWYLR